MIGEGSIPRGNETRRKPEQLIEAIQKYPDIDIYRRCVDEGGVVKKSDSKSFITDNIKVGTIVDDYREELIGRTKKWEEEGNDLEFPSGFNPKEKVKVGAQEVVRLLSNSGLVDLQTIRSAARFAGPGNVVYVEGQGDHAIMPTSEFHAW